ncbi:oocyte-secreted protein 1 [Phodopus roborovskii]|uniref:Oosp1 protein n=1 Tax=Phodopus roborovskii TaxID=109678 RepID=A0AAU9ZNL0_PHORO|nr:oocyte-secreted protein 1 [Phodopus roborovskii]CAH6793777.1 Oosp1 [Phodopus roborovskii]
MKSLLGLQGLLLLLFFMRTCADDWSAIRLQCTNHWFYLRIKATIFPNIFMEPDEVFLGIGCPVTNYWPNDIYDFTYRTYACGIVNKVIYDVTLLQTKLTYISKNGSLRAQMPLSCVLHSRYPLLCEAEIGGDFTGNPPEWVLDMRIHRNKQAAPAVPPNFSTSSEDHQVSHEPQTSVTSKLEPVEVCSFMDQKLSFLHFSGVQMIG